MPKKEGEIKEGNDDLDLSKNPVIIEMGKTIRGLGILLTQQQQTQAKTNENLNSLVDSIKEGKLGTISRKEDNDDDPDAINDLDNSQLVKIVLGEVGKLLDKKIGSIGERIDKTDRTLKDRDVEQEVKALVVTNPDLFEWSGEIKSLSDKNPGLSIKQLYTLAKDENPTKVAEMKEKFKKEGEGEEKDKPGLLGFMPTSGVTVGDEDEKLTKKEAGEQAWEKTLEDFPALAQLGEG